MLYIEKCITNINKNMKKKHLSYRGKIWAMLAFIAGSLMFTSCAQDGFDDETWKSDVTNSTLSSPSVSDITITASADGSKTEISWPVVYGAGGYICSVYDVTDAANPVAVDSVENELIDGCSLAVTREEDKNYMFSIKTAGNEELNNTEAATATEVTFTSFTETFMTIPAGSDLTEWFAANPVPVDSVGVELCYDLEAGGSYTMSGAVDFYNHQVTLRTTSPSNPAKITFSGTDVSFKTATAMTLKYLDIDCSASTDALIELTDSLDSSIQGIQSGTQAYYDITGNIVINGCDIEGVNGRLIYDGNIKYCVNNVIINNSTVHLTTTSDFSSAAVIHFRSGFADNLTIQNSTFWNTGDSDVSYFVQYSNSCRNDRGGYASNSVNYYNCTFYKVAYSGQWGNYSGFAGRSTSYWNMTYCIFVDCGSGQIARRFLAGRTNQSTATFRSNTYMYDGAFVDQSGYDNSGTAIEEDPGFADPTNGDFTVSNATHISAGAGDPRWLE